MLMVDLMATSNGLKISILGVSEHFEALVDKDIVDQEIGQAVQADAQADPEQVVISLLHSEEQSGNSWNGEDQEEGVVVLQESLGSLFVVVPVQVPKPAVHDVFMGEPGHSLHPGEGRDHYANV